MNNVIKTQSTLVKFVVAASFLALGCVAIGRDALAAEPVTDSGKQSTDATISQWSVTYPVGFSDLDVSKLKDTKTLYLRIRYAAQMVCESAATWGKKEAQACVTKAIDEAVTGINRPLLTQYSQLRSQHDKAGLVRLAKSN